MNRQARSQLSSIYSKMDTLTEELDDIMLDQQAVYDNIPENLQQSERGIAQEEIVSSLDNAVECFHQGLASLQEAINR